MFIVVLKSLLGCKKVIRQNCVHSTLSDLLFSVWLLTPCGWKKWKNNSYSPMTLRAFLGAIGTAEIRNRTDTESSSMLPGKFFLGLECSKGCFFFSSEFTHVSSSCPGLCDTDYKIRFRVSFIARLKTPSRPLLSVWFWTNDPKCLTSTG